jgi:hypothetical protein
MARRWTGSATFCSAILLFSEMRDLPPEAQRITDHLRTLLAAAGLTRHKAAIWGDILVDHAHGAAIAVALGTLSALPVPNPIPEVGYRAGLATLLAALSRDG